MEFKFYPVNAIPHATQLGESPIWSTQEQCLYFVDILAAQIHRYDPILDKHTCYSVNEQIGCIGLRKNGGFVAGMRSGIYLLSADGRVEKCLIQNLDQTKSRFNDGCIDPWGRFWCGSLWEQAYHPQAQLLCIDQDQIIKIIDEQLCISNGLAFSPDRQWLYYSDSEKQQIYRYRLDPNSGEIISQRELIYDQYDSNFFALAPYVNAPDGATFDAEGHYWSAQYHKSSLLCMDLNQNIQTSVPVNAKHPTKMAFGGKSLNLMFVTTAQEENIHQQKFPYSGRLLMAETSYRGVESSMVDW